MNSQNRKQKPVKSDEFWKGFYTIMLLIGIILMTFEIKIYRKTIIELYIPISIILVVGLSTFYFSRNHYKKIYLLKGFFYALMQNLMSWGFICCYIFMATNYYLAKNTITEYQFQIKEKSSIPGRKYHRNERQPLVKIDYFNFEKELIFRYLDTDKIDRADSVTVVVRKGGLGFDILEEYDAN